MTRSIACRVLSIALATLFVSAALPYAQAADAGGASRGDSMTFRQAKELLAKHTKVVDIIDIEDRIRHRHALMKVGYAAAISG